MKKSTLVLISERNEDLEFAKKIASFLDCNLAKVSNLKQFNALVTQIIDIVVFLDLDFDAYWEIKSPFYIPTIQNTLRQLGLEQKTFFITSNYLTYDDRLRKFQGLFKNTLQQSILRNYHDSWVEVTARAISPVMRGGKVEGLKSFFSSDVKVHNIEIKHSAHKMIAATAVENVLKKYGVNKRVSEKISLATDELIMNALFDAPKTQLGSPLRQNFSRKAQFELHENEHIDLSLAVHNGMIGICVSDIFGSLEKETLLSCIRQGFKDEEYKPKLYTVGSGLGIYGIIQSGLSFYIQCRNKQLTQAFVFAPVVKNFRDFKKMQRFSVVYFI